MPGDPGDLDDAMHLESLEGVLVAVVKTEVFRRVRLDAVELDADVFEEARGEAVQLDDLDLLGGRCEHVGRLGLVVRDEDLALASRARLGIGVDETMEFHSVSR